MKEGGKKTAIIWFRQDLRLHDNEALHDAMAVADHIVFAYIFDERWINDSTSFGFKKTGRHRAKFILESVADLRASLREMGQDLYVRIGKPEEEIFELAKQVKSSWVYCNRERTSEEVRVQSALEKNLWTVGQELRFYRGKMLLYTADLPFPVTQTPDTFTQFRKEVEKEVAYREPFSRPEHLPDDGGAPIAYNELPTLSELGYEESESDDRAVIPFKGGERSGLERLKYYLWDTQLLSMYKETRNGLLGGDYSSKFSPWLAQGCLSPKQIVHEIRKYESVYGANKSTYWLIFELLWRDFFRFMGKKYGDLIFKVSGTRGIMPEYMGEDDDKIQKWINGETGIPFIDANMRELKATGFMSNRGRQNVASFFIKDLEQNWLIGAEYFESVLIDYDPCSNYGNLNYIAGVGADPREDRYFNIMSQAKRYDPKGDYVRYWIPELGAIEGGDIHHPEGYDKILSGNMDASPYLSPVVSAKRWL